MLGDALKNILNKWPDIFTKCKTDHLTYLFKEIIIMELILLDGKSATSKEIQNVFIPIILSLNSFPSCLKKDSISAKGKSKLKVMLNNVLSSNLNHSNGLNFRKEVNVFRSNKKYLFRISDVFQKEMSSLKNSGQEYVNVLQMINFIDKYKYLTNFFSLINYKTNYCQKNYLHINNEGLLPLFFINTNLFGQPTETIFICRNCIDYYVNEEIIKICKGRI